MTPEQFDHLLSLVQPYLSKNTCPSRQSISPEEMLAVCLRYLATGDSQQTQSFSFRLGRSTVCRIIRDTCDALLFALKDSFLKVPSSIEQWKRIASDYESEWNYPHCIGAIDGKHVCIECPSNAGSAFYNYKNYHSMVLLAVCDAHYTFTMVDICRYERDNDASIFGESYIRQVFEQELIQLPQPEAVNGIQLPYTFVGDEIFPLKQWLMKPYPGSHMILGKRIYNYQQSRARRTIENAFGILAARWRIFRRPIRASPETAERIIKATVCLHNYLRLTDNAHFVPTGFVDSENSNGEIIPGDWRNVVNIDSDTSLALRSMNHVSGNRYTFEADTARNNFLQYFNSKEGELPWQLC